jgi:hypothetical protein
MNADEMKKRTKDFAINFYKEGNEILKIIVATLTTLRKRE